MSLKRILLSAAAVSILALASTAAQAQTASVVDPGTVGGVTGATQFFVVNDDFFSQTGTATNFAAGYGVSLDGTTLVGAAATPSGFAHAFRYTTSGGIQDLGSLSATGASYGAGVNLDGSVVVGTSQITGGRWHAFRWTMAGMQDLGALGTNPTNYSVATDVSADGSVVVGGSWTDTTIDRAFRWTAATGMVNLGTLNNNGSYSDAHGVSADGNVVVGVSTDTGGRRHAFRWTQGGGMADLGTIGGATGDAIAAAANADGSVVVGFSSIGGNLRHAFRWTGAGGMADLGAMNPSGNSTAYGVNGDGSIVVGASEVVGASGTHAFVWTSATGMQDLNILLANAGVSMSGVNLTVARDISSNGQFIAGSGSFPNAPGAQHAYLARIGGSGSGGGGGTGVTTPTSVINSIRSLSDARTTQIVTNSLLARVLLGTNEQVSCGDCGGAYVSFGSFNASSHGRKNLSEEISLLGGLSYGEYGERGAAITQSWTLAAGLRIDPAHMGASRPFFEFGGTVSPRQKSTYSREYANGSGVATGEGSTYSTNYAAYARVGWVNRITRRDEIAASVSLTRQWQRVDAYAEAGGNDNPFNANLSRGTDTMSVANFGVQATHMFNRRIEGNLNVGVSRSFNARSAVKANVAGAGAVVSSERPDMTWYEVGGRIGIRLFRGATLDLFINSTLGPDPIGSSAHGGGGVRWSF